MFINVVKKITQMQGQSRNCRMIWSKIKKSNCFKPNGNVMSPNGHTDNSQNWHIPHTTASLFQPQLPIYFPTIKAIAIHPKLTKNKALLMRYEAQVDSGILSISEISFSQKTDSIKNHSSGSELLNSHHFTSAWVKTASCIRQYETLVFWSGDWRNCSPCIELNSYRRLKFQIKMALSY